MTPIKQTICDADDGNCFAACVASILDLPIGSVPNFAGEHGDDWEAAASEWLHRRGLSFLTIGFANYETFAGTYFADVGSFCILSGPSTYVGRGHAVVGVVTEQGAIALKHDPAPTNGGLPIGHRWVRFIVPLAVRQATRRPRMTSVDLSRTSL
jgi:hypothetical protein